jgi:uncharacterized protein (TIGR00730 family)
MKSICVFCGSSSGNNPEYKKAAIHLGTIVAKQGLHLIYGGSQVGLMASTTDAVLGAGGRVTGVITKQLQKKVGHKGLTRLHVVRTMHARKKKMFDLSDAFVALPGGTGTFEEILEIMTWAQLGLHTKPFGLLNTCGYYNKLIDFLDFSRDEGFIKPAHREMMLCEVEPETLLQSLKSFIMPSGVKKWIE